MNAASGKKKLRLLVLLSAFMANILTFQLLFNIDYALRNLVYRRRFNRADDGIQTARQISVRRNRRFGQRATDQMDVAGSFGGIVDRHTAGGGDEMVEICDAVYINWSKHPFSNDPLHLIL